MDFERDERTVVMPPASVGSSPPAPRGTQDFGSGLDEGFAVEAGERELLMSDGDHDVLLGGRQANARSVAEEESDDIWGEVSSPASPLSPMSTEVEDSSTVFMSAPPPVPPQASKGLDDGPETFRSSDYNEIQYDGGDLDATWRMPDESPSSPAPDYGGFEDFAEPAGTSPTSYAPPPIPKPAAEEENVPPLVMPPPLTPSPEPASFEDYMPSSSMHRTPPEADTRGRFPTDATLDAAVSDEFERISDAAGFGPYGEPEIVAESEPEPEPEPMEPLELVEPMDQAERVEKAEPAEALFETSSGPVAPRERSEFFDEIETADTPQADFDDMESAGEEPASLGTGAPVSVASVSVDDALIEKVAQRVVDKLSQKVIQEIAWEVVPDLAEGLILKEIAALKAKIPN